MSGAGMSGDAAPTGAPALPEAVRALAAGDFSSAARRFADAGFAVELPAPGMLQVKAVASAGGAARASVLVSVGVHGDETGPIEVLAHLLGALSLQPSALAVDLMLCVGNLAAIRHGKRCRESVPIGRGSSGCRRR